MIRWHSLLRALGRRHQENDEDNVAQTERARIFLVILYIISVFLACLLILVAYQSIHFGNEYRGVGWPILAGILAGCGGLILLIRCGFVRLSAAIFLIIYFLGNAYGSYRWGASMPSGLLSYTLFITIAGVIMGRRFALIAAGLSVGSIAWTGLREYGQHALPLWKTEAVTIEDIIAYAVMLFLAAFLSWLFTRSIEESLGRALASEQALKIERDNLETTVIERTKAWKEAELRRVTELGRFIEFGKLSAGLFHDLINPLTAVSLSFQELEQESAALPGHAQAREAINRAVRSARRMEEQISRLRKHMKPQSTARLFDASSELHDLCTALQYQARRRSVELTCDIPDGLFLIGDPVMFYQACANIVINSLDSFGQLTDERARRVSLIGRSDRHGFRLAFSDNGSGMDEERRERIFEPFYTTKADGLGLGLAMVKDIITNRFNGTIHCQSAPNEGTIFFLTFPAPAPDRTETSA